MQYYYYWGIKIHLDWFFFYIFQIEKLEANLPELDKKRQNKIISVSICRAAFYSHVEYTCMTALFQWRSLGPKKNYFTTPKCYWSIEVPCQARKVSGHRYVASVSTIGIWNCSDSVVFFVLFYILLTMSND